MNPLLCIDGYKTDHRRQYPEGTEYVYSNFTPRKSRMNGVDNVVVFGLQYFMKEYLVERFNKGFFDRPKDEVVREYKDLMDAYLGEGAVPVDHVEELHELGHLPIRIKSLPEGARCPIRVPMLTIVNTNPRFFWLTNQLETILSASLWQACTSATIASLYRDNFNRYNEITGVDPGFTKFQGHDFSFRGMSSSESAMISGAGHLTSFVGTDTVPAIKFVKKYYGCSGLVGASVPATEHSVMCMGGEDAELKTYRRLINEIYPKGAVSIVSDTWDFWSIMTAGIRELHDDIVSRDGKVVFRPDSGDPELIICGDPDAPKDSPEGKGAYQLLLDEFGSHRTKNWYRGLNSKVGLIYGDSITLQRQVCILENLKNKGYATDVLLGIGSYSYQYNTRDTFGFAMKATWGQVSGQPRDIFKSPKTDKSGEKKSAKGFLQVHEENGAIILRDQCDSDDGGLLNTVFEDGQILREQTLDDIRSRLWSNF